MTNAMLAGSITSSNLLGKSQSNIQGGCLTNLSSVVTIFIGAGNCGVSSSDAPFSISAPGTISNLYVQGGGSPGSGHTFIWTIRKNGSAQSVTCTVSNAATTCNDVVDSFSVSAGDFIDFQAVGSLGASTSGQNWASVTFQPQ